MIPSSINKDDQDSKIYNNATLALVPKPFPLADLPNELIVLIFSFLGTKDLSSVSQSSKAYQPLAIEAGHVQLQTIVKLFGETIPKYANDNREFIGALPQDYSNSVKFLCEHNKSTISSLSTLKAIYKLRKSLEIPITLFFAKNHYLIEKVIEHCQLGIVRSILQPAIRIHNLIHDHEALSKIEDSFEKSLDSRIKTNLPYFFENKQIELLIALGKSLHKEKDLIKIKDWDFLYKGLFNTMISSMDKNQLKNYAQLLFQSLKETAEGNINISIFHHLFKNLKEKGLFDLMDQIIDLVNYKRHYYEKYREHGPLINDRVEKIETAETLLPPSSSQSQNTRNQNNFNLFSRLTNCIKKIVLFVSNLFSKLLRINS